MLISRVKTFRHLCLTDVSTKHIVGHRILNAVKPGVEEYFIVAAARVGMNCSGQDWSKAGISHWTQVLPGWGRCHQQRNLAGNYWLPLGSQSRTRVTEQTGHRDHSRNPSLPAAIATVTTKLPPVARQARAHVSCYASYGIMFRRLSLNVGQPLIFCPLRAFLRCQKWAVAVRQTGD